MKFKMTIKAKILCLVAAFAVLASAITALSLNTMSDYKRAIAGYRHASQNAFNGERLNRYLSATALEMRGIYMARTEAEARAAAGKTDASADQLSAFIYHWHKQITPGELPQFAGVEAKVLNLAGGAHFIARYARDNGHMAANSVGNIAKHRLFREQMQADIDAMVDEIEARQALSTAELAHFETRRQQQFMLIATAGILLLLAGSMWMAVDSIANPLSQVRRSMVRVSEGDYDTPIPAGGLTGEIGELWGALDILKARAIEAERLTKEKLAEEHKLRELVLD